MNEYLKKFTEAKGDSYSFDLRLRHGWCQKYSWSVPNTEALETIAALGPVLEIGAGAGYWAYLLREMGVDVLAYDVSPPSTDSQANHWHSETNTWTEVLQGNTLEAAKHPERTLFLCWPPYDTSMGVWALKAYKGNTFVYIGEDAWGCTGDREFHELVAAEWTETKHVDLPQYAGIHDFLIVYTRKSV